MSDSIFRRAKDVLGQVVELPDGQRQAGIDALCGGDEALGAEVRSLLAHHAPGDERLEPAPRVRTLLGGLLGEDGEGRPRAGAADPDSTVFDAWREEPVPRLDGPLRPGARLGSFVLGERLGSGGMGVVYEAQQDAPRRRVALKVVAAAGGVSPELLRRFRREVHVLGRLEHPGIAALYEAGAVETDEGLRPYFAMQRVDGQPLARWVEEQAPPTERLVELVATLCDAVAHAHARGVVHRDLKPGNLLVDGAGRPTVLDFGVARLDDAHTDLTSLHTEAGSLLGTLPYMSPEQVSGRVDAVDARADVYALGVVLFEALAGRLPLEVDGLSVPAAALVIQREEPSRLDRIDPTIDPGLALIVDTALAKEPERRYADAGALGDDLRRWLDGQELVARPLSARRRATRFVRRHRALTAGVAVAFVALLAALLVTLDQARSERRIRRQAEREADRAKVIAAAAALDAGEPTAALERLEAVSPEGRGWEWAYHRQRLDGAWRTWEGGPTLGRAALIAEGQVVEIHRDGRLVRRVLDDLSVAGERRLVDEGELRELQLDRAGRRLLAIHRREGHSARALLFDLGTGEALVDVPLSESGRVRSLSVDGRSAIWIDDDRLHLWWEGPDGPERLERALDRKDVRSEGGLRNVRTAVHGTRVAVLGQFGDVTVLDVARPELAPVHMRVSRLRASSLAFLDDGRQLLVGLREGPLQRLDTTTGERLQVLEGHRGPTDALAVLPGDERLVSVGQDRTLRVWDLALGRAVEVRSLRDVDLLSLRVGPRGERLVLSEVGGRQAVHDLGRSARCEVLDDHESYVYDVAVLTDGTVASVSWDKTLRLWSQAGKQVVPLSGRGEVVLASPVERQVLVRSGADLLRVDAGSLASASLLSVGHGSPVAGWTRDGRWLVSVRRQRRNQEGGGRLLSVVDGRTGEPAFEASPGTSPTSLALGLADDRLVTGHRDGMLRSWSLPELELLGERPGDGVKISALALSPDGRHLACGTDEGLVTLLEVASLEPLASLATHPGTVWDLAFHPEGDRLATACHDGVIRLFDVPDGQPVTQLRGHADYVKGLAWSPDGTLLASGSGDGSVRVWHSVPLAER